MVLDLAMLRLERLEIAGFKSFVDPVAVSLHGGITAVVGPNGCGKSNISDAITWVLGEQSAKSLRGDRMEDVIFNGSERRQPLGLCEVTMTLKAEPRPVDVAQGESQAPGELAVLAAPGVPAAPDGRVLITRRIFRSGESQYRLNGKLVRLKDVKDLLMDTGLGIRAYSVIEQGKIGQILSGKPQERRKLLEEAAGVTRYKNRKRVAELKLEEATANLQRVDDVISEVDRALKTLRRQASAAQRYQEREAEYRQLLERVLLGRWSQLQGRLVDLANRLAAAADLETSFAAQLHRDEASLAAGREEADRLAAELARRHEHYSSLAARIEGRQEFLKNGRGSLGEIRERITASRRQASERATQLAAQRDSLGSLEKRRLELAAEIDAAESAAGLGVAQLKGAEEQLTAATRRLEEQRQSYLGATGEITALRNRVHQEQIELERGNFRRNHLAEELDRYEHEVKTAAEALEIARETLASLERRLAEKEDERDRLANRLDETVKREAAAIEERRQLEHDLMVARQRQKLLDGLAEAHSRSRQGLEQALAEAGLRQPIFLEERLRAVTGWERSLDFYLGSLEDAVLLADEPAALDLAYSLAGGRSAATLVSPLELSAEATPAPIEDPAVALSLGAALGLAPALAAALPPAYLVNDSDSASRLARLHPGVAFISPGGVWAQGGLLHVEGGEALPGYLERESERQALAARVPELAEQVDAAVRRVEEWIEERARQARETHRAETEINQLKQELAVATARRQDADARHRRLTAERTSVDAERDEIERLLAKVAEKRGQLASDLDRHEARLGELHAAVDLAQREVDAAKAEKENLRAETTGRQGRLELLRERLAAHDRDARRISQELSEGERQIQLWNEEAGRLEKRQAELAAGIEQAEIDLASYLAERASAEETVLAAQARLDEHKTGLRTLEATITGLRSRHDEARSGVEELRVAQAGLRQESEHLAGSFREHFEREPPADPAPSLHNLAELEVELARKREVLERMGPVNALAVEELGQEEERFTFLTAQRADVVQSVESLRRTIREINQASSERFKETFLQVNKTFGEVFERLFRGGEAEMRLLDEEDLLESGIEIVARPPGKRLQNIMLMSGGEKALTAIALLFALFRAKPSPFCILDEVDAPLDDSNALRFVELIRELSDETQFIVITHNKQTMQVAHTLYGVTMEERGVSKVVAVELDDIQPAPVRATA